MQNARPTGVHVLKNPGQVLYKMAVKSRRLFASLWNHFLVFVECTKMEVAVTTANVSPVRVHVILLCSFEKQQLFCVMSRAVTGYTNVTRVTLRQ